MKHTQTSAINLPKDDAPHQSKMEWWYYNGRLQTKSGKQFSFHFATFVVNGLMSHVVNHVSLTDLQTGQHYIDQRRTAGNSSKDINRFSFDMGDWVMSGSGGVDRLKVSSKDFSFDLNLQSNIPAVVHGDNGLLHMGAAGSSYYYSRTRMSVSGTVKLSDSSETVDGMVWFDHQWGEFLTTQLTWDWFSLQLDDGADVMLYNIKDKADKPILVTGTDNAFKVRPKATWKSTGTNISYPVEWQVNIPEKNININIRSVTNNNEFDAQLTTYNIYWEGAVNVRGSHSGQGFIELNGYTR
ncbi:MAG: lipocalin-like domain-containing protein [Methylococcales bacterium]